MKCIVQPGSNNIFLVLISFNALDNSDSVVDGDSLVSCNVVVDDGPFIDDDDDDDDDGLVDEDDDLVDEEDDDDDADDGVSFDDDGFDDSVLTIVFINLFLNIFIYYSYTIDKCAID